MAWLQPLPVCNAPDCRKASDVRLLNNRNVDYGVFCHCHGKAAEERLTREEHKIAALESPKGERAQ